MPSKIILASSSTQREKILKDTGITFEIVVSNVDETPAENLSFTEQLKEISMRKALAVMLTTVNIGDRIIVAADQNIMFNGKMYGKPKTIEDARELIRSMEGSNEIYAYVGNSILEISENKIIRCVNECDISRMRMDIVSSQTLEEYLATKSPLKKCGGINIFDTPFLHLEEGKLSTAGGLTVEYLIDMLDKI